MISWMFEGYISLQTTSSSYASQQPPNVIIENDKFSIFFRNKMDYHVLLVHSFLCSFMYFTNGGC